MAEDLTGGGLAHNRDSCLPGLICLPAAAFHAYMPNAGAGARAGAGPEAAHKT